MNEEKSQTLKLTTDQIESKFGKGAIMKFGDSGKDLAVEAIPTGALALDAALGIGGVPRGRIDFGDTHPHERNACSHGNGNEHGF